MTETKEWRVFIATVVAVTVVSVVGGLAVAMLTDHAAWVFLVQATAAASLGVWGSRLRAKRRSDTR